MICPRASERQANGGVAALKAISGPYGKLTFMPTGTVNVSKKSTSLRRCERGQLGAAWPRTPPFQSCSYLFYPFLSFEEISEPPASGLLRWHLDVAAGCCGFTLLPRSRRQSRRATGGRSSSSHRRCGLQPCSSGARHTPWRCPSTGSASERQALEEVREQND